MERAYARYRANQVEDCLQDLAKLETGDSSSAQSILWLKGQAEYRRGNYDAAAKVYEQLIKEEADDPSPEGLANLSAAYAGYGKCTDLASECEDVDTDVQAAIRNGLNNDSYELLFNQSCSSFKSGRPLDCVSLLDKAQQTCISEMQKDGASQEETDEEVSVFLLQKAVLYHKLGFFEDASKLYALVQSKTKDESISSVACANSTLLGGRHAWYEALKQVDHLLNSTTVIQRLTTEQVKQLQLNRLVLLFQLNKKEQCRYAAKELQTRYPESSVPFLVDGLLGTKRKGQKNDSHEDFDFSEAVQKSWSPWERDLASIFIAEKHRKSGEWGQSSKLLERLSSERYYQAAVLASLLYQKMRCEKVSAEQGEQLLKQVMQQTETAYANGQTSSSQLQEVLRVGIAVYLDWESYSRVDDLCEQLGTLSAQSGNDFNGAFAEASRFTAHVRNPSKSVGDLETLLNKFQHSCSRNVKSTIPPSPDAAAIVTETLPWGRDSGTRNRDSRISKPEIGAPTKGGGVVEPQKKVGKNYKTEAARERRRRQRERQRERHIQKLKAARVSANVPLPAPDPERWIPRLDRSYNRARRKKESQEIREQRWSSRRWWF
eukprot:gb/GECG01006602.1/.p1 GENE.gb/GECG01006602.1/~~gb/GECG01006602.1/.p1  ORF type:complete len:603 (+),score=81.41 gb/GECG01006602.1/:1-1809(+)